jgi:hypothetical protein
VLPDKEKPDPAYIADILHSISAPAASQHERLLGGVIDPHIG